MEPFTALLLTIVIACLIGYRRGSEKTLNDADAEVLGATYREYLRAVSAAGLVRLSNFVGESPADEDLDESGNGPRLIADMVALLEGREASTVIEGVHPVDEDKRPTVKSFLAGIADDADKYWPEQISEVRRLRESLS